MPSLRQSEPSDERETVHASIDIISRMLLDCEDQYRILGARTRHTLADVYHNDTPLAERSLFSAWRDLNEIVTLSLHELGDISRLHQQRFSRAVQVLDSIIRLLEKLRVNVESLEEIYEIRCSASHGRQLNAGRTREDIVLDLMVSLEDGFEDSPVANDLWFGNRLATIREMQLDLGEEWADVLEDDQIANEGGR
ncbi:hypothetical protein K458DRAFT_433632 [Lentithecium fluviatile CBS 122367]|uniref:Uncharacterized protein n=1 Tax=Lentithecium fluviatile CBS 122367 TaxID=1168545 RepID=A0A6G1IU32_9PLEO|nr:hypothetical protein K458DRAFT_433632 [Lentithecium fluviatile CBS 122367]